MLLGWVGERGRERERRAFGNGERGYNANKGKVSKTLIQLSMSIDIIVMSILLSGSDGCIDQEDGDQV